MKNLDDIWQEYTQESLNFQTLKDLIWHIENDLEQEDSIIMATDMLIQKPANTKLKILIPYIAKQLDHEDDFIREITIHSLVGRLHLSEYAEKALDMAQNDVPYGNVRGSAAASLGNIINKVDYDLRKKIAVYLNDVIANDNYDKLYKQSIYRSILKAMEIPFNLWPPIQREPDITKLVDKTLLKRFKVKYCLEDAS